MGENNRLRIAFYGKGGIGKSTIAANTSAAFSKLGLKVLHIGCDPKGDSTRSLAGKRIPSVLKMIQEKAHGIEENDIVYPGYNGIGCVEAGGPEAGLGCVGMGITAMAEELKYKGILDQGWDIEIYDVQGDAVCGGISDPIRERFVDVVYIVSSSEFMSIYAANNIMKSIKKFSANKGCVFGGIIHNHRNENSSKEIVRSFAEKSNTYVLKSIPYCSEIVLSEFEGKTVIEKYPESKISSVFMDLAIRIKENVIYSIPKTMDDIEIVQFSSMILEREMKNMNKHGLGLLHK